MGILQLPIPLPAQVGIYPATKKMVTTDNLGTITTAGYLNAINLESYPIAATDVIEVLYSFNTTTNSGTFGIFTPSISNGVITLNQFINGSANSVLTNAINTMQSGSEIILAKGTGTATGNAVTINQQSGVITTAALTTAAGSSTTITLTNSFLATTSVFMVGWQGGTDTNANITLQAIPGAGTGSIIIYNDNSVTALNGTFILGFTIF